MDPSWIESFCGTLDELGHTVCGNGEKKLHTMDGNAILLLVLSPSCGTDPHIRRDVEHTVNLGLPVFVARFGNVQPEGALRYYLSPCQWMDVPKDDPKAAAAMVAEAMAGGEAEGTRTQGRGIRWTPVLVLTVTAFLAAVAFLIMRGGSTDFLVVGHNPQTVEFIGNLGYDVETTDSLPSLEKMEDCDVLVLMRGAEASWEEPLYEYLSRGGSILLCSGQSLFLGMPDWLGMEVYSNYWAEDFDIVLTAGGELEGYQFQPETAVYHQSSYMDGGAVLRSPVTAVVDACYAGNDSLAAAVRNTVGTGRVAWVSFTISPRAAGDGSGYTTEAFRDYMEALYRWLDRDGPGI
ncbi:MAG: hypothetical protein AVO35_06150 [Candidatus Aegiribacteria sp. MLS_C]|nr:MAG: hypothetical protein AVO35_06150 [Candidatus Aegiribacteria sp. MLS_C]